jgi:hypothetical protein
MQNRESRDHFSSFNRRLQDQMADAKGKEPSARNKLLSLNFKPLYCITAERVRLLFGNRRQLI